MAIVVSFSFPQLGFTGLWTYAKGLATHPISKEHLAPSGRVRPTYSILMSYAALDCSLLQLNYYQTTRKTDPMGNHMREVVNYYSLLGNGT